MTPRSNTRKGRLDGEVAIISGASGGMGEATSLCFAREGAKVAIHYSGKTIDSEQKAKEVGRKLESLGCEAISVKADVSVYSEVQRAVDEVIKKWGKVTLAVCFAGLPSEKEFWQEDPLRLSDDELLSAINVDFLGSYHFIKACKDHMKHAGHGKIVLTSSTPAIFGEDIGYRYALAKGLNRQTVKSLAPKLIKEYGVYLNAISPGTFDTSSNRRNYDGKQWKDLVAAVPLQRAGSAEEIARVALFLCSRDSDYVVGQTLVVDGGEFRL